MSVKLPKALDVIDAAIEQWTNEYHCCYRREGGHGEGCPLVALQQLRADLEAERKVKDGHQCWFVCQGCGVLAPGYASRNGTWQKPSSWYERSDDAGIQTACSRECIDVIAAKTGKTRVILPI